MENIECAGILRFRSRSGLCQGLVDVRPPGQRIARPTLAGSNEADVSVNEKNLCYPRDPSTECFVHRRSRMYWRFAI
jgi:hypothetical protein